MAGLINRAPLWDPDNPIGTDTILPQQSVGMPRPSEDARTVGGGMWGEARPISADAVRKFGEGSNELYEQAALAALGGEMPKAPSLGPRRAVPYRAEIVSPNEQEPGGVTGLTTGTMGKQEFANAASWREPITGRDRLVDDVLGRSGETVPVTGAYLNAAGEIERNPAMASRYMTERMAGGTGGMDPRLEKVLSTTEATRGLIDFQEGQPWSHIDTTAPSSVSNSLKITGPGGRPANAQEMIRLGQIAEDRGLMLSNTPDGVALLNLASPGEAGYRSGGAMERELQTGLQKKIDEAFPGSVVDRGRSHGDYVDYSGQIGRDKQGQGTAVKALADRLEEMKVLAPDQYMRLIRSPAVAAKAQENIERLFKSGQADVRPDYVRMLNIVSGGRLEALLKHMLAQGSGGLPAVAGIAGPGTAALVGAGSTPNLP